ncbi:hypothetical protein EON80_00450 [bacterium]|nr:MAG: hypothetical protein EON80_00450 [bacterium]
MLADKPSVHAPSDLYDSYVAGEAENVSLPYNSNVTRFQARKVRSTYFNPLSGVDFDLVINPVIIEPVVQLTTYVKVQYGSVQQPGQ